MRPGLQPRRLREAREARGLNQPELAALVGFYGTYIAKIESELDDRPDIGSSKLSALAVALHVSADWLLGITDDRTPHGRKHGV